MQRSQKVASKWNGWLRDSLRVNRLAWRCWCWFPRMAALRRSCVSVCRANGKERKKRPRVAVKGRKWKIEARPSLRWFVQVTTDWRDAQWHVVSSAKDKHSVIICSDSDMTRLHSKRRRDGGSGVWECGAVQEWLPCVELRDESRTGILFCQLECANGNVRAAGKLMNLIGEMPPLSSNAWSIAIVFSGRWCFFSCYFLIVFSAWPGCLRLKVWWWTLNQGEKGIDLQRESMLSSVTYKSRPEESDFGFRTQLAK